MHRMQRTVVLCNIDVHCTMYVNNGKPLICATVTHQLLIYDWEIYLKFVHILVIALCQSITRFAMPHHMS